MQEVRRVTLKHGLAFYGTFGFVAGFFGARLFATLNPSAVVVQNGVHFHHFWYGLAMVTVTGWLGIAFDEERLNRSLALVFGLGTGLIGDEVGLLLTFDNYTSELTTWFFVGATGFIIMTSLFLGFRKQIEKDVIHVSTRERLVQVGVLIAGLSTIFFAFGNWRLGGLVAAFGVLTLILASRLEGKLTSLQNFAD